MTDDDAIPPDPELALALRVSLEEQRHRQEEKARKEKTVVQETQSAPATAGGGGVAADMTDDDAMLRAALELSMEQSDNAPPATAPVSQDVDISNMTEDEQIAYALQMSMQTTPETSVPVTPMQVDTEAEKMEIDQDSNLEFSVDAEFLESVLQNLPGQMVATKVFFKLLMR